MGIYTILSLHYNVTKNGYMRMSAAIHLEGVLALYLCKGDARCTLYNCIMALRQLEKFTKIMNTPMHIVHCPLIEVVLVLYLCKGNGGRAGE